jgi:glycosyltransferase involved in cell wall biosynthesis
VPVPVGATVGSKRNIAIHHAHGELVTWFDDDDWQHPRKLELLAGGLSNHSACIGTCTSWFVDLVSLRCARYVEPYRRLIFNGTLFRREEAFNVRFSTSLLRASDTLWMREFAKRHNTNRSNQTREDLFFWLCHERNISNPAPKRAFPQRLDILRGHIGNDYWGDTDFQLEALRSRLSLEHETGQTTGAANHHWLEEVKP